MYNELVCMYSETHQHYNLETVGSTDYGTVDPLGVYDVDDTAEMCYQNTWCMYLCTTSWKNPVGNKINLEFYKEQAILSKKLVTINCDVPIEISPADLVLSEVNHDLLKKLMVKFEFRTMLKRFYDQNEH